MSRRMLAMLAIAVLVSCGGGEARSELLEAHRSVWEAWYEGDTLRLRSLLPDDLIAINNGGGEWAGRDEMIRASAEFRSKGGQLVSLTFPRQEVQEFGNVAVLYSDYEAVSRVGADTTRDAGRATEVFVRRGGEWINPGWHLDSGK